MLNVDDTIAAIASPPGESARGILRLSGPDVVGCVAGCFNCPTTPDLCAIRVPTRLAGTLNVPMPIGPLECDVYLWPNIRSYTRQPSAEVHTFGSPPLLGAALQVLCAAGARLAEPGEFTLRAFLAGRLDLTQAEAVLGVIDANSQAELHTALAQLAGGVAGPLNALREELLELLAHLEAGLDFVDEDIEFITRHELERQLADAAAHLAQLEAQLDTRATNEELPCIVLFGWPNVGKSSLFNVLGGDSEAIVSPVAGTTRDYLTRRVSLAGHEVILFDTAGAELRERATEVPTAAQKLAARQSSAADLQLFCLDATRPLNEWEKAQLNRESGTPQLVVLTKTDLPGVASGISGIATSSATGEGLGTLRQAIGEQLDDLPGREYLATAPTANRCRESLRLAAEGLRRSQKLTRHDVGQELVAAEIRAALDELGKTVGAVYTDDILDRIFGRFCIGK